MAKYYIAVLMPVKSGGYSIMIPDFPEIASCGTDLDDAMYMAEDALKIIVEDYAADGTPLPEPSSLEAVQEAERKEAEEFGWSLAGPSLYPLIKAPDTDNARVRISLSIARNVLHALDDKARKAGLTRSGWIARMATA